MLTGIVYGLPTDSPMCGIVCKPDGLVLSALTAIRGTVGSDEGILLLAKWCLTKGRDKIHNNSKSCGGD
jgi:hypothetical protein